MSAYNNYNSNDSLDQDKYYSSSHNDDDICDYIDFEDEDDREYIDFEENEDYEEYVPEPTGKDMATSAFKELISCLKMLLAGILIAFIVSNFIIYNAHIPTGSMRNTIMDNDRIIGFRLSYIFSSPQRGDIIIFKNPEDLSENFVKRVIGTPGDVIVIENGSVSVNGEVIDEPYIAEPMKTVGSQVFVVPENSYFVMGDNRNNSHDSRYWSSTSYVKKDLILAKAIFRYYNGNSRKIDFKSLV